MRLLARFEYGQYDFGCTHKVLCGERPDSSGMHGITDNHQLLVPEEINKTPGRKNEQKDGSRNGAFDYPTGGFKCKATTVYNFRTLLKTTSGELFCNSLTCFTQSSSPSNDE